MRSLRHPPTPPRPARRQALCEPLEPRHLLSTYYVATNGSDSNAGTSTAPFLTIQAADPHLKAGDTLNIRAGTYAGFVLGWDSPNSGKYSLISGTPTSPITIQIDPAAAPGSVIINSANAKTTNAIDLEDGDNYIIIKGLTVSNAAGGIPDSGIRVNDCLGVSVLNNTVDHINSFGIYGLFSTNMLVQGNTVTNGQGTASTTGHGIYIANSAVNPMIIGNIVHNNANEGLHFNGDVSEGGTGVITGAVVEGNLIYANGANGINGDGFANGTIENNILYGNARNGIALYQIDAGGPSANNLIINNTVYQPNSSGAALELLDNASGCTVYNNIFIGGRDGCYDIDTPSLTGLTSDYNVVTNDFNVFNAGGDQIAQYTLAQWRSNEAGKDTHSFIATGAQLFTNATGNVFTLAAGSLAIDAGTSMSAHPAPTVDFAGNSRPQRVTWDIGAYEASGGATLLGEYIFYKGSTFDTPSDDNAIAPDKTALQPGHTATFANYTSYSRGINGIMLDIGNLPGTLSTSDFVFRIGNSNATSSWAAAPAPLAVTTRPGAGVSGSARVEITWADNAIQNEWLQITLKSGSNSGLGTNAVFYFGNAIGETGDNPANAYVTAVDELGARANATASAALANIYDFNRDGQVNATDQTIAGGNYTNVFTGLSLISVPAAAPSVEAAQDVAAPTTLAPITPDVQPVIVPLAPQHRRHAHAQRAIQLPRPNTLNRFWSFARRI